MLKTKPILATGPGAPTAEELLSETLNVLATMTNEETARTLEISVSST